MKTATDHIIDAYLKPLEHGWAYPAPGSNETLLDLYRRMTLTRYHDMANASDVFRENVRAMMHEALVVIDYYATEEEFAAITFEAKWDKGAMELSLSGPIGSRETIGAAMHMWINNKPIREAATKWI